METYLLLALKSTIDQHDVISKQCRRFIVEHANSLGTFSYEMQFIPDMIVCWSVHIIPSVPSLRRRTELRLDCDFRGYRDLRISVNCLMKFLEHARSLVVCQLTIYGAPMKFAPCQDVLLPPSLKVLDLTCGRALAKELLLNLVPAPGADTKIKLRMEDDQATSHDLLGDLLPDKCHIRDACFPTGGSELRF